MEHADPARRGLRPDALRPVPHNLGIAPNILARRLKALTEAGLLEKTCLQQPPPREDYRLTDGRARFPAGVLHAIGAWAHRHAGPGPMTYAVDAETGTPIEPVVMDRITGAPIGARPLRLVVPEGGPNQ